MVTIQNRKLKINTDINIISNLTDFSVIKHFIEQNYSKTLKDNEYHGFSDIKTIKSLKRFESAVKKSLISYGNGDIEKLINSIYFNESVSIDYYVSLFWNLSYNNDLFGYLNDNVYFPALYSGRISIKSLEVQACIKDLQNKFEEIQNWTPITIAETSSSYLRILKKLNLMEGGLNKTLKTPHLSDKMFVLFVYWLISVEEKSNILNSKWLNYSFMEKKTFVDRLLQKKFSKFYNVTYTGDNLKVEPIITYDNIYDVITKS